MDTNSSPQTSNKRPHESISEPDSEEHKSPKRVKLTCETFITMLETSIKDGGFNIENMSDVKEALTFLAEIKRNSLTQENKENKESGGLDSWAEYGAKVVKTGFLLDFFMFVNITDSDGKTINKNLYEQLFDIFSDIDIDFNDYRGDSLVHYVASFNIVDTENVDDVIWLYQQLIDRKIDVNTQNDGGKSVLHVIFEKRMYVRSGNAALRVMTFLKAKGANFNQTDNCIARPIYYFLLEHKRRYYPDLFEYVFHATFDDPVPGINLDGQASLLSAVLRNKHLNDDEKRALMLRVHKLIHPSKKTESLVCVANRMLDNSLSDKPCPFNYNIMDRLLQLGLDINKPCGSDCFDSKKTLLFQFFKHNTVQNFDITRFDAWIARYDLKVNASDHYEQTALFALPKAISSDHVQIGIQILDHMIETWGMNVAHRDRYENTVLQSFISNGVVKLPIIQRLVEHHRVNPHNLNTYKSNVLDMLLGKFNVNLKYAEKAEKFGTKDSAETVEAAFEEDRDLCIEYLMKCGVAPTARDKKNCDLEHRIIAMNYDKNAGVLAHRKKIIRIIADASELPMDLVLMIVNDYY